MPAATTKTGRTQRAVFVADDLWEALRRRGFEERRSAADLLNERLRAEMERRGEIEAPAAAPAEK